jgi:hypothetical protein
MANAENIEKVRQGIMRFRELLDIMQGNLDDGNHAYQQLFARCSPEELQGLKEKDQQTVLAQKILDDRKPLGDAILRARFDAREMERAFEELYNIVMFD